MADNWCTIESDPGVFTELIQNFGVQGIQVEELWSLDEASFASLEPVYGLVFLFKWNSEQDPRPVVDYLQEPELFFANQVITNACATQALLSILLNTSPDAVDIGQTLREFKSFTLQFPPIQEPFIVEESKATEKDDVYHFIAYVPFNGKVYELDGLKPGPILLGEGEDWLSIARPAIQQRIERYATSEIRFNLLAVIKNRVMVAEERLETRRSRLEKIEHRLAELQSGGASTPVNDPEDSDFTLASTADELRHQQAEETAAIEDLTRTIDDERVKFRKWKAENVRRKHNYIPFVMQLLKILAERGQLQPMVEAAKSRASEQRAAAVKAKHADSSAPTAAKA